MVDAELMEIGTGIDIVQIIEGDAHRMVGEHRLLANQASRLLCDGALVSGVGSLRPKAVTKAPERWVGTA